MHYPHPWRRLREMERVILHWTEDLPDYLRGVTDGERVWMRSDMSQVERRCVLAHELEHIKRRHSGCQPGPVESVVRSAAAHYLIPSPHLLADAVAWAHGDLEEAADVLWVTDRVLRHRLEQRHLHPAEKVIIQRRICDLELGC